MRKMKLLFLISTLTGGGAERVVCNLSRALEGKAQVDILVNAESEDDYPHAGRVMTLGLPFTKKLTLPLQIRVFFRRLSLLRKLKREGGYDACISFMNSSNFANILSGRKHCPVVVSERIMLSLCDSRNYNLFVKPLVRLLYKKADIVTAVSRECADDLKEKFSVPAGSIRVINNGLDLDFIGQMSKKEAPIAFEEGCFYFLNIGRLSRQKGQAYLIRAFGAVCRERPDCRLVICGTGPLEAELRSLCDRLGIGDKVVFAGFCDNPYAIAARCHAYVSTSLYEGFSNVLIEAMACSLPVISADFRSSAREILAPDTDYREKVKSGVERAAFGLLTPSYEDPSRSREAAGATAKAMRMLLEDEELCASLREASARRAKSLDIDSIALEWLKVAGEGRHELL